MKKQHITLTLPVKMDSVTEIAVKQTIVAYTDCYNRVAVKGWEMDRLNAVELHHQTYYSEKETSGLPSQLICSARGRAVESIKSAQVRLKKGKRASCPKSFGMAVRYDKNSSTIRFNTLSGTISTVSGRKNISFTIPEYFRKYTSGKICTSEIAFRKGGYILRVTVEIECIEVVSTNVVGVDLGVNRPAVTSDNKFYGERRWKDIEQKFFNLKRSLQSKGTKSAKRHLKKLSRKVNRFRLDCDHVLSRRIVDSVESGTTLVFEDLTDIRDRVKARLKTRRRIHSWSFSRLKFFVGYKGIMKGISLELSDPRYTSQKCSRCGYIDKRNRKTQSEFCCKKCSFKHNADLNASKNIRSNHLVSRDKLSSHGLPVNQPIVARELVASS